jgi:DNA polymerase IV
MLGKKRKKDTIKLVREADRIFNGFEFFFLRNDDKSPLRKRRITLSREHGAIWTTIWTNRITHLIVDNDLTRKDVLTYLKLSSLPPQVIMVNEEYLSDCFIHRRVMNSLLKKYQVKDPDAEAAKQMAPQPASENSESSLQLKAPKSKLSRWENPSSQETPPRTTQARPASYLQQPPVTGDLEVLRPQEATTSSDKDGSIVMETQDFGALTEWIQLAKDTEGLPLDNEDEDAVDSTDHSDSDDGGSSPLRAPAKRVKRYSIKQGGTNQANFQCMTGGTAANAPNPNDYTISVLERLGAYYKRIGDQWRTTAYQKACGMLRKQDHFICTYEEAIEIRAIGHRLAEKIVEIATTGRLRRLESAEADPTDAPLKLFVGIYGVSTTLASEWLRQGHRTLDDLVKNVKLSENQKIGIEHYDDLQQRIPREEVTALGQYIKDAAAALDPDIEIIIGGSYRRGALTSGDIDILISKPHTSSTTSLTPFLHTLITHLTCQKFLVAALAVPHSDSSGSKWHGCCVLPSLPTPIWRRIDFLLVPASERGAALLYFTGDDIFNRSMRLLANKRGMSLNQRGLYENVMRDRWTRKKVTEGSLVEGREERRIFERLGVPWREPWERVLH